MAKTLATHLNQIHDEGKALVVPYIMAGDGGIDTLDGVLHFLEDNNVSAIEVGIPFSDPVADGPVIQLAGLRALEKNVSLESIIDVLKQTTVTTPLVIMSYFNPILHYGIEKFVKDIQETPVKGLIIPDLPYEHQDYLQPLLKDTDIALVPLLSLTSSRERMRMIAEQAEGFIYAVTVNGTTGERVDYEESLDNHLKYLTQVSPVPVLAGFGVSEVSHVERFADDCDGVIIGSKIVKMINENQMDELSGFLGDATEVKMSRITV